MVLNLLAGIAAKLSAAGVAAKTGVGLAVAAASVGGAAAVGVIPEVGPSPGAPAEEIVVTDSSGDELGEDNGEDGGPEAADHDNFGATVSADASDPESPGVDGRVISGAARTLGSQHRPADAGADGLSKAGETPAAGHVPETVPGGPDTADQFRPEPPATGDTAPEPPAGAPEGTPPGPGELPDAAPESAPGGAPTGIPGGRR